MSNWDLFTVPKRPHDERHHFKNADMYQKLRLAQRQFGHMRNDVRVDVVQSDPGTIGYLEERHRFGTDAASEERTQRDLAMAKREAFYDARRTTRHVREEGRWAAHDSAFEAEKQRQVALQGSPAARRNRSSVPYNPISHQFHESAEAQKQRFTDDCTRYRADLRKINLYTKSISTNYDPITGRDLEPKFPVPPKPQIPLQLTIAEKGL